MDNIDIKNLEKCFLEVDAECRALKQILSYREQECNHLRQIIDTLITCKSPTNE